MLAIVEVIVTLTERSTCRAQGGKIFSWKMFLVLRASGIRWIVSFVDFAGRLASMIWEDFKPVHTRTMNWLEIRPDLADRHVI